MMKDKAIPRETFFSYLKKKDHIRDTYNIPESWINRIMIEGEVTPNEQLEILEMIILRGISSSQKKNNSQPNYAYTLERETKPLNHWILSVYNGSIKIFKGIYGSSTTAKDFLNENFPTAEEDIPF